MSTSSTRNPNLSFSMQQTPLENQMQKQFAGDSWWTGLAPEKCPGFDKEKQCLFALPLLNIDIATRQDVLDYFDNTWTLTELLFRGLKTESTYTRPPYHQLRHPLIFYYGHPAVLFINKLRVAGLVNDPLNLYLEKILETGVDEMSWDDMSKNEMNWPSVATVHAYRKQVYNIIRKLILEHPALDINSDERKLLNENKMDHPLWALWMGFEHEKIHFETSSVLIRELPLELVETPQFWPAMHPSSQQPKEKFPRSGVDNKPAGWKKIKAQSVRIGKNEQAPSFGWDNEYGSREVKIKDSEITETLISNGEYYEFVRSGAYINDKYWQPEGLMWRKFRNTKRPTFWIAVGPEGLHEYKLRTIFSAIDMPWSWPAEVNFHEAKAYCKWKQEQDKSQLTYRLLSEAEHVSARDRQKPDPVLQTEAMKKFSDKNKTWTANFNFQYSSPSPVDKQMMGNVWHWVEDQFNPLTGFKTHSYYDDFSTPCFDGRHQMIMGGSFMSCGHEASEYARFHFRPHFYQHAGFRMARTLDGSDSNGEVKLDHQTEYSHPQREDISSQMQKTDWWKSPQQPLHTDTKELQSILNTSFEFLSHFQKQFPNFKARGQNELNVPYQTTKEFPTRPQSLESVYKILFNDLIPLSQMPGHPKYAAYLAGSSNPWSAAAQLISAQINAFTGHYSFAPGLVQIEAETIKWFIDLFQFPQATALGFFTTGGSSATLSALSIAKKEKFNGYDLSKARVYASEQSHHCIGKSLSFLGFPEEALQLIDTNSEQQINLSDLQNRIKKDVQNGLQPFCLVGTAGSTPSGAIDNLSELRKISTENNLWLHIDGAYGALFYLTQSGKTKLHGIHTADSLAFDPHKTFSLPYGTGALLVRDRKHLLYKYSGAKTYMPEEHFFDEAGLKVDYSEITPDLSRDFKGLKVWLPLKVLGISPFIVNLEEKLQLAKYAYEFFKSNAKYDILEEPQLSVVNFACKAKSSSLADIEEANERTLQLLRKSNQEDNLFLSSCMIKGRRWIRIALISHQLHFKELEAYLKSI